MSKGKPKGTKKLTIEDSKTILNQYGFELIGEYYNTQERITIKDEIGYYYFYSLTNVKLSTPNKFHISNPYTIQNINLWCRLNNKPFYLISSHYKGNSEYLRWKCSNSDCGEIFEATWNNIHNGKGCGYCCPSPQKIGVSNCLATKNPNLAKEWHPTKNGELTPYDVAANSGRKVWWQCNKNSKHEWKNKIYARNNSTGNTECPFCSHLLPSKDYNLKVINPRLCKEWNYNKNKSIPEEYCPNSNKKVWWVCEKGHEWFASINNRNGKKECGCLRCNKSKGEKKIENFFLNKEFTILSQKEYEKLNNNIDLYFIPQKRYFDLLGVGNGYLSYDFYIPKLNLLIEYQGEQHDKYFPTFHKTKEKFIIQKEHDRRKKQYAKDNNIRLLEIWYWDFNKIEEILEHCLKFVEEGGLIAS